jgi:hypothetical protein
LRGSYSVKPSRCVFHERGRPDFSNYMVALDSIEWTHWGTSATGRGRGLAPGVGAITVAVRLSAPQSVCGHPVFTVAKFRYPGESTFGVSAQIDKRLPGC